MACIALQEDQDDLTIETYFSKNKELSPKKSIRKPTSSSSSLATTQSNVELQAKLDELKEKVGSMQDQLRSLTSEVLS